ncbi:hypothetical protein JDV02_002774 [Purpureocillium takamizusanense]|uniref:Peptidase M43 pregnancy-associated plasma-A domain-containing protein n=1 Tax=Purpureocillium takamizusanense TaxID=2060973 RepID=A0A9Q8QCB8_9HYPO|nr:uncharacterized protein JDV02_002774 [Purpureocillium takamizusanense]UNI16336.1 hypothetical protein JDV02_002774 [Purpureocillium takamizusanense]
MFLPFALLPLLAPAAIEAAVGKTPPCAVQAPKQEFLDTLHEFRVQEANATAMALVERAQAQVNTYVHIIAEDRTSQGGYVDQATIDAQIKMLNSNFASTGFSFVLRDVDYTIDPYYARLRSYDDEWNLKKRLRKGEYKDLNLYYFVNMFTRNTGWCWYPTQVNNGDNNFIRDGCVMHVGTMPGGSYSPWNQGKLTSHEVGHWMGLLHTFEGGCGGGDYVDDTPAESSAAYGCPTGRDTCTQPGQDPIHNFMDYSDNSCQSEFTTGQINRMWSWWDYYRA